LVWPDHCAESYVGEIGESMQGETNSERLGTMKTGLTIIFLVCRHRRGTRYSGMHLRRNSRRDDC
jgi:hypothetical protein